MKSRSDIELKAIQETIIAFWNKRYGKIHNHQMPKRTRVEIRELAKKIHQLYNATYQTPHRPN